MVPQTQPEVSSVVAKMDIDYNTSKTDETHEMQSEDEVSSNVNKTSSKAAALTSDNVDNKDNDIKPNGWFLAKQLLGIAKKLGVEIDVYYATERFNLFMRKEIHKEHLQPLHNLARKLEAKHKTDDYVPETAPITPSSPTQPASDHAATKIVPRVLVLAQPLTLPDPPLEKTLLHDGSASSKVLLKLEPLGAESPKVKKVIAKKELFDDPPPPASPATAIRKLQEQLEESQEETATARHDTASARRLQASAEKAVTDLRARNDKAIQALKTTLTNQRQFEAQVQTLEAEKEQERLRVQALKEGTRKEKEKVKFLKAQRKAESEKVKTLEAEREKEKAKLKTLEAEREKEKARLKVLEAENKGQRKGPTDKKRKRSRAGGSYNIYVHKADDTDVHVHFVAKKKKRSHSSRSHSTSQSNSSL